MDTWVYFGILWVSLGYLGVFGGTEGDFGQFRCHEFILHFITNLSRINGTGKIDAYNIKFCFINFNFF